MATPTHDGLLVALGFVLGLLAPMLLRVAACAARPLVRHVDDVLLRV